MPKKRKIIHTLLIVYILPKLCIYDGWNGHRAGIEATIWEFLNISFPGKYIIVLEIHTNFNNFLPDLAAGWHTIMWCGFLLRNDNPKLNTIPRKYWI